MDIAQLRDSPVRRALSPLNFARLIDTQHIVTPSAETREKSPNRRPAIECWKCPECFEVHDWEDEAEECCAENVAKHPEEGGDNCPICAAECISINDASNCCLWKDFDAPTRWKIAADVEAGASWIDAIAARGNK